MTFPTTDLAEYVLNKCITQDEKQISIGNFSCSNPTVTPDEPVYYNFDFLVEDNQILDWMVSQESRNRNVCTHVQFKHVSQYLFHYAYVAVPGRNRALFHCVFRSHWCVRSALAWSFHWDWGSYALCKPINICHVYTVRMSPALNGSSALQCFERSNAIEIHNRIMFDFYPALPHMYMVVLDSNTVEPLLTTTRDSQPPCLWRTLTLVLTASPFKIALLSRPPLYLLRIADSFHGPNCTQTILNDPDLADTFWLFPQDCPLSLL